MAHPKRCGESLLGRIAGKSSFPPNTRSVPIPATPMGAATIARAWFGQSRRVFKDSRRIASTCSTCTSGTVRHRSKKFCERWMTLFARERFSTWECRILLRGKPQECKPSPSFAVGLRSCKAEGTSGHRGDSKLEQLENNLGSLDAHLSPEQMKRLDDISRVSMGFPHELLANPTIKQTIHGGVEVQRK